jgi:hypothetical protein
MAMDGVAWEANNATGPLLYREVPENQLVSVRAKISAQTQGNWSQAGVMARIPNAGVGENWMVSWSFRPAGAFQHQSNLSLNGAETELNDAGLTAADLQYIRLDNLGGGMFQAFRGSGPNDTSITWTPQMDAAMMPQPQTNANLVGQTLQVGPAAGAIGALANANVLFDWVEIQTTSQTFRDDFNYTRDLAADGVLPGGIWTGVVNAGAGGFNTRVAPAPGRCVTCTWNVNGSGNFNVATNYMGDSPGLAFPPSGDDTTVIFGPVLTAAAGATVYTNTNVPIKELRFDNMNTYALAGPGAITLDSNSGNALINVLQGNHEIQADLILNDNVTATAAAGSSLNINTPIYLNGHTFTVAAGSTVNMNGGQVIGGAPGAGQFVNDGYVSGLTNLDGNLVQSASGSLVVEAGGAPIQVAGAATLTGVLEVELANSFLPVAGASYPVLTAASVTDLGLQLSGSDANLFHLVVGDGSVSLVASGIPEPSAVALAAIAFAAVGFVGRRRRARSVAWGGFNLMNIQRVFSAAVFFCSLLAVSTVWAQQVVETRRDDFGNATPHAQQHDFTTGMVPAGGIWNGIHNPTNGGGDLGGTFEPAVFVRDGFNFDNSIDKAGKLHVEDLGLHANSNMTVGTGWEPQGDKNTSPFLFTSMDAYYDFDAIIKIDEQTAGNWSYAGLIARVAGPPVNICCGQDEANSFGPEENFVTVGAFRTDAANVGNATLLLQNTVNGGGGMPGEVNTDLAPAGAAGASPIWVRVIKRGGSITGASSEDGTTWLEPANAVLVNPALTRSAQGQAMLEIGPTFHTYLAGISGSADFDFFELTIREPSTPTDAQWMPPAAAAGSGNWNAAGNWTANVPGTIPNQNTMNVLLGGSITGPSTIFNNAPVIIKSLTINNANKYAIGGTGSITMTSDTAASAINVQQGSHEIQVDLALANNTTADIATGAHLEINNSLDFMAAGRTLTVTGGGRLDINNNIDTTAAGLVLVDAGNVGGNGRVNGRLTNNGGSVSPGTSVGTLTVEGNFQQNAAGTLNIELGGTAVGQYDQLRVIGGLNGAVLDGTLDVSLVNGFVPAVGNTFDVITTAGGINNAGIISLHSSDASSFSLAVVSGTILRLTATSVTPPMLTGDFNNNGVVDAADYVLWRDGGTLQNDPTPGNDAGDYNVWRSNFGKTNPGSAASLATRVPEPATCMLAMMTFIGACLILPSRRS